ncbi:MAG: hypothetical protein RL734_1843 [Bacteroidota bacterium]|jgi:hypothetical protein
MKHFTQYILILLPILFGQFLQASEADSALRIVGSIGGGASYHSGGFSGIPSVNTCCTTYPNTQSSLFELMLGLRTSNALMQDKITLQGSIQASISQFNALFSSRDFVGSFINGNTVTQVLVDYSLALSGMMIGLEPRLHMHYSKLPISLFLGFNASSIIANNAHQIEKIIKPNDVNYTNGTKELNRYDGNIEGLNSLLFSGIIGMEYQFSLQENLLLIPSIAYRTYFNSFIADHPWSMNGMMASIGMSYAIPKPEKTIEIPPPPPPPIEEKEPEITLSMHFHALLNDAMVEFGDTIPYPYERNINVEAKTIAPIYMFEKNSSEIISEYGHEETLLEIAIKQGNAPLRILAMASDQESENMAQARAEFIKKKLLIINPERRIQAETRIIKTKGLRYPELIDESRMVMISYADGTLPIYTRTDTQLVFQETSIRLITEPSITGAKIAGMASLGNVKTKTIEEPDITFSFSPSIANPIETQKFIAQSFVTLEPNLKSKSRIELYIRPILLRENVNEIQNSNTSNEYILGYSDFDEGSLSMIDHSVIQRIKRALNSGTTITMIPLIDDLGKSDHNSILAKERVKSALQILESEIGKNAMKNFTISSPRVFQADGRVSGRVLHRGISIRIGE